MNAINTTTTLALADLRIDEKANVRKIGRGADPQMMASIKAIGVRQPLLVRPNGKGHVVIDGGKRLEALQALAKNGELPADYRVPVIVGTEDDAKARETSLALNIIRTNMHPVDEFRAFHDLHHDKKNPQTVDDIATRFGIASKAVIQRLALAELDDSVLDAWKSGRISEEAATTFTLTRDKKAQAKGLKVLLDSYHGPRFSKWQVKEALKLNNRGLGRFLHLIGEEAYTQRGGKVERDLFGDDHQLSDDALMQTMLDELVQSTCKHLVEAEGWAWALPASEVENSWSYGRLDFKEKPTKEEAAKLKELAAICEDDDLDQDEVDEASDAHDALTELIRARGFTPEQKKKGGCFVEISNTGKLQITYGRTKPSDKKLAEISGKPVKKPGEKAPPKLADFVSQALLERLSEQLTAAGGIALVNQPNVALAAMLAGFASGNQACTVSSGGGSMRREGSFASTFEASLKLSTSEQIKALTAIAAKALNFVTRFRPQPPMKDTNFAALCNAIDGKAMNKAIREKFDAKDYFDSVGRNTIVAAVREAIGPEHADKVAKMKKPDAAKFAIANVPGTGWLPTQLRTAHYDGPAAKPVAKKAAKKPAKAAAKKPAKAAAKKAAAKKAPAKKKGK